VDAVKRLDLVPDDKASDEDNGPDDLKKGKVRFLVLLEAG